jgi:hypothetical protein
MDKYVGVELLTLRVRLIFCLRVGRQDVTITVIFFFESV